MRKNVDQLVELAVVGWDSSSYDSIFSVKYEVRSSPQSEGETVRETTVCVGKQTS